MAISRRSRKPLWIISGIILFLVGAWVTWALLDRHAPKQSTSSAEPQSTSVEPAKTAYTCVESLPNKVKVGQKLMFAGYNDQIVNESGAFAGAHIGGVIIMNETPGEDIIRFKASFTITPTIGVDQEGGTVQRYTSEGTLAGASVVAATQTPQQAYNAYLSDDTYLKSLGITTNFAPVLGVTSASPSALPGRMYSDNVDTVTTYATQAINASFTAGITPVVKHFPGLGTTSQNTDLGSATLAPLASLEARDIIPYKNVASLKPDAMVSNAIVPDLTDGQPASWSPAAVALLRSYGYEDSVIYSDSLTAKAVPGTVDAAVVKAWQAGIDVAMIVQQDEGMRIFNQQLAKVLATATNAVDSGILDNQAFNESVLRILNRKGINPCLIKLP